MVNNGTLLPNVPIAVDHWRLPKSHEKFKNYLYFLSHLHTDHTQGLTSTWTQKLYTSEVNRNLAIQMLKVKPQCIEVLEIGVTKMLTLPPEHGSDKTIPVSVTLIDSNHIKGSVMFLFEGHFGKILCTGDFRINQEMFQNPILKNLADSKSLDLLYVDNTFEEIGNDFPSREECMKTVLKIVKDHPYHRVIFGSQAIGKEDVLLQASLLRKEKVYAPDNILAIYSTVGMPMTHFTQDQIQSNLWYESLRKITDFDIKMKNAETPTIAIRLTASGLLYKSEASEDGLVFCVPYSNHCSSVELALFLNWLQPHKVERIVKKRLAGPGLSVIDKYTFSKCELTLDESSESDNSMAMLTDDEAQETNYIPFTAPGNDQVQVLADAETIKDNNMDEEVSQVGGKENNFSTFQRSAKIQHLSPFVAAKQILDSICLELNGHLEDPDYIHTDFVLEKLMALHKIYEPVTGIHLLND